MRIMKQRSRNFNSLLEKKDADFGVQRGLTGQMENRMRLLQYIG